MNKKNIKPNSLYIDKGKLSAEQASYPPLQDSQIKPFWTAFFNSLIELGVFRDDRDLEGKINDMVGFVKNYNDESKYLNQRLAHYTNNEGIFNPKYLQYCYTYFKQMFDVFRTSISGMLLYDCYSLTFNLDDLDHIINRFQELEDQGIILG